MIEIRSFLGLAGYYRKFVAGFSSIALAMTKLTGKDVSFEWIAEAEAAFQELKRQLCTTLILTLPRPGVDYMVYTDAYRRYLELSSYRRVRLLLMLLASLRSMSVTILFTTLS